MNFVVLISLTIAGSVCLLRLDLSEVHKPNTQLVQVLYSTLQWLMPVAVAIYKDTEACTKPSLLLTLSPTTAT